MAGFLYSGPPLYTCSMCTALCTRHPAWPLAWRDAQKCLFGNFLLFDVWSDLLVILRKSHFRLDSDSEGEALRRDSLRLVAVFLGLLHSLGQKRSTSVASFLFFLVRCLFGAAQGRLCYRTRGGPRRRVVGALAPRFFPSLCRGFLTTHCQTSSCSFCQLFGAPGHKAQQYP